MYCLSISAWRLCKCTVYRCVFSSKLYYCWSSHIAKVWNNRVVRQSCSWSAEQEKGIFSCPCSRPRIWSCETGPAVPSRVSLLILHIQAESGAYSRDSSRLPPWRPFIYAANRHRVSPEFIGHALAHRWCSLPRVGRHSAISPQGSSSNECSLFRCHHGPIDVCLSFPTPLLVCGIDLK